MVKGKVQHIAYGAFRWCVELNTINLPDSLETIEEDAFEKCPLDRDIISRLKELGYEQKKEKRKTLYYYEGFPALDVGFPFLELEVGFDYY